MKDVIAENELNEKLIEDIKAQLCFVTTIDRSAKLESENPPASPPNVQYYTTRMFEVPGTIREKAFEVLWDRDADNLSIPTMILNSLLKVPVHFIDQKVCLCL